MSKPIHFWGHEDGKGGVYPACTNPDNPRALSLKQSSWTLVAGSVTCLRCLEHLRVTNGYVQPVVLAEEVK